MAGQERDTEDYTWDFSSRRAALKPGILKHLRLTHRASGPGDRRLPQEWSGLRQLLAGGRRGRITLCCPGGICRDEPAWAKIWAGATLGGWTTLGYPTGWKILGN